MGEVRRGVVGKGARWVYDGRILPAALWLLEDTDFYDY